jgi:hypothetical protein
MFCRAEDRTQADKALDQDWSGDVWGRWTRLGFASLHPKYDSILSHPILRHVYGGHTHIRVRLHILISRVRIDKANLPI